MSTPKPRAIPRRAPPLLLALAAAACTGACSTKPAATRSGFLPAYDHLAPAGDARARYVSSRLADYTLFIVDPVLVSIDPEVLTPEQQAEIAEYFRAAAARVVESAGFALAEAPGPGIARVRLAVTDVAKSTPWQKLHPAARFAGAGTGGAAMEGEIVDSLTGEQLAAAVQAASGNQFNLTAFSTLDDVKGAIDKWADDAVRQIRERRETAP